MPAEIDQFLAFIQGLPVGWQMLALFGGTFILEDLAAIAGGLLLAAGSLGWNGAFWPCFLGIWLGDVGLYALARMGGRTWFEQSRFSRFNAQVNTSEQWFARRGNMILIFSRLLPGARLPTYLAAGFLRVPWARFLLVTGTASLLWAIFVLVVAQSAGTQLIGWLKEYRHGVWLLLSGLLVLMGLVHSLARIDWTGWRARLSILWARWTQWEFWPGWLFYPPVALWCLWLAVKYRGLSLPTAANPGIFAGGVVGESKMATLLDLWNSSPEFTAEAELISGDTASTRLASLREICRRRSIPYPFILKPDMGQRGVGVKLIRNELQAEAYLTATQAQVLVQRHAPGPMEAGVFYYRFPQEQTGHIFALTEKVFPFITGDGKSTLTELIHRDSRARIVAGKYLARLSGREHEVLAVGTTLRLVEAGNHAQGCIFQDGAHLITPDLERRIDEISRGLDGFFIGRYDLRYASVEALCQGKDFQIIELNGAAAEATSIYDARNSLGSAYRTLFRQWELVFAIGAANRARGQATMPVLEVWRSWRHFLKLAETYPLAD